MPRQVRQFGSGAAGAQEQAAAAHVAAPDKIRREKQPGTKTLHEGAPVFGRGDAAEQDRVPVVGELRGQGAYVARQGPVVAGLARVDIGGSEGFQVLDGDAPVGRDEPAVAGDDANEVARGRVGEAPGVGQFSPEVQGAHEGEDLPDREALAPKLAGKGKRGLRVEQHRSPGAADLGRGEEEEAFHPVLGQLRPAPVPGRGALKEMQGLAGEQGEERGGNQPPERVEARAGAKRAARPRRGFVFVGRIGQIQAIVAGIVLVPAAAIVGAAVRAGGGPGRHVGAADRTLGRGEVFGRTSHGRKGGGRKPGNGGRKPET